MLDAIKELVQQEDKALDMILITGDLAKRGKREEYQVVEVFCQQLLDATGVPGSQLFLVPGNHDVDRGEIDKRHLKWWYDFEQQDEITEILGSPDAFPALMRKFSAFNDFAERVMGRRVYSESDYYLVEPASLSKDGGMVLVNVAGLNSALFAGYDGDDRQKLAFGLPQMDGALRKLDERALLTIALFHHPFECFHPADKVCRNLLMQRADLILTGHLHEPDNMFVRGAAGQAVRIGAGASFETRESENSFNVVEIDLATGAGEVQFYKYLPDFHRWKENTDANPDHERGIFPFVIEKIERQARQAREAAQEPPLEAAARAYEVRLVVNRQDGAYAARWIQPEGQESESFPLILPLTAADTADLRWYLETYYQFPGAGDRARAQGVERRLEKWGRALFDAVFDTPEGTHVYRNLIDAARAGQRCLLTVGATDPDVLGQPWEMMRDRRGPLAFQGVTVRRQLRGAGRTRRFELGLPLRVLLIVSRPTDTGFIDPRNSIAPLLDALEALPSGQVAADFCDPPTLARLEETISQARRAERPYHIVHFDGHGTYLPKTGIGALCFERDDAALHLVTGRELGDLMARLDVPLVLLEACRTSTLSDRPVFGSVAPALLESGVGSVVAFSHAVHVEAARLLVERFYRELCSGLTVGQALEEARTRLRASPARWLHRGPGAATVDLEDWFIPQLYQVGADPALIAPDAGRGRAEADVTSGGPDAGRPRALHGFPPPPAYRFHGRALELLELERAFRRHAAVVLTGMGGMGKTALAREAADWWLRTGRFEAAVFCSFEQKAGAERAVQLLGQALEGDAFSARSSEDQWRTAVDLFRRRRVLFVWDNFESTLPTFQRGETPSLVPTGEGQGGGQSPLAFSPEARARLRQLYRDLTADSPVGRLLVTCRPAETGLPGVKEMPLGGLARPDSLYLLAAVLDVKGVDTDRTGYERAEIDRLLHALADHPLSIELVAPHLKELKPAEVLADYDGLLERFADAGAFESRNKSLLASLEFSKRRFSEAAQAALPYLAWFEGGAFEASILGFANLERETWAGIRAELVATALVSVEELEGFTTPYVRFHPTLPYAAQRGETSKISETSEVLAERFIAVYLVVRRMAHDALRGRQPAAGMALLAREEANLRAATARAFARGARREGWAMANTLGIYLEMAGRLRERNALVAWVRAQMPDEGALDGAACEATWRHAWSLFTQGRVAEAIEQVQALIGRLEAEGLVGGEDPTAQIALGYHHLGRIYYNSGRPDLALEPLQKAMAGYERLGVSQRGNLSAALGDLANAYLQLGRFDAALEAAERGLAINRELGRDREVAVGLGMTAHILTKQGRYAEAEARYAEALRAARAAGDLGLQGTALQHQGILQDALGHYDRAVELYQQAIGLFQRAGNPGAEMQTCDLLATAEANRGQLDAAEAWYARSRELALELDDRAQLAVVAQNVGVLYQNRAEAAADPGVRAAWLRRAVASVEESLAVWLELGN